MTPLTAPLRLRPVAGARKVTWLELFFDLIFVAAVAEVAEPLREHYSVSGMVRFATLFALIWWAWSGYTLFATRFNAGDAVQRALTLVQMFVVAVMAANAGDELDSRSTAGFAAAYAALRLVLVAQYFRARHVPETRPLTTRYIAGHGLAAIIWLGSAFVPAPARYWVWAVAFAIDLGTPWLALPHSIKVPPDPTHLPERFGLFTLILLGEAVVALMHGIKSQEEWSVPAASSAFLGVGLVFLVWWWYFEIAGAASERTVRNYQDALRFHLWSYAHFPFYLGLVVTGVGLQRIITASAHSTLTGVDARLMTTAAAVMMISLITIAATFVVRPNVSPALRYAVLISVLTVALGPVLAGAPPVVIVTGLVALSSMQIALTLRFRRASPSPPTAVQELRA